MKLSDADIATVIATLEDAVPGGLHFAETSRTLEKFRAERDRRKSVRLALENKVAQVAVLEEDCRRTHEHWCRAVSDFSSARAELTKLQREAQHEAE